METRRFLGSLRADLPARRWRFPLGAWCRRQRLAAGDLLFVKPASTSAASASTRTVPVTTGTATETATADGTVKSALEVCNALLPASSPRPAS